MKVSGTIYFVLCGAYHSNNLLENIMKKKQDSIMFVKILQSIAPTIGANIVIEPEWGFAGQITFKNGKKSYFKYNTLDLNPVGASDIAKDKDFAHFFMERLGYPIVPCSKTFFSKQWADAIGAHNRGIDDAYHYARAIRFPVVVKPNSGSQGKGVALVHTKRQMYQALRNIFKNDRVALVQKYVSGKDYRLVVLDDEVLSAYERIPLNVIGNNRSTIAQLLSKKQAQFKKEKRDTCIKTDDPRIAMRLARQGLSMSSVLSRGTKIFLLDNANLSTGGDAIDVTAKVHPEFARRAIALTKDMGLRFCGVDFVVAGDIQDASSTYWVLEINAAPGLDHYVKSGKEQQKIVEALYLKVMMGLERSLQ